MFSSITPTRRATMITVAGVAVVTGIATAGVAVAVSTSATSTTIKACVKKSGGAMRQVGASTKCKSTEKSVSWNVRGVAGPKGVAGPAGPVGPAGESGAT